MSRPLLRDQAKLSVRLRQVAHPASGNSQPEFP